MTEQEIRDTQIEMLQGHINALLPGIRASAQIAALAGLRTAMNEWSRPGNQEKHKMTEDQRTGFALAMGCLDQYAASLLPGAWERFVNQLCGMDHDSCPRPDGGCAKCEHGDKIRGAIAEGSQGELTESAAKQVAMGDDSTGVVIVGIQP